MKKLSLFIILVIAFFISNAQIALTYTNQAFRAGDTHITREAAYVNEGKSGPDQIWDFSDLKCIGTKTSMVKNYDNKFDKFQNANFEVNDDESSQYYNITSTANLFLGLTTPNAIVQYDKPIVKMKYPFTYGNSFDGVISGKGIYDGTFQSSIYGNYKVEADGYGTLILPNNVFNNVLRVKSVSNHTEVMQCASYQIETIKYLWYSKEVRYPLLIITVVNQYSSVNGESVKKYVYYNEKVSDNKVQNTDYSKFDNIDNDFSVYPNPFKESLNFDYNLVQESNISIELYNYIGEKIDVIVDNQKQSSGNHSFTYNTNLKSLNSGVYFIKYIIDDKTYLKKIIKSGI